MQQQIVYQEPEYVQYTVPTFVQRTPRQDTRGINSTIDNTLSQHLDDTEVKMLKQKISDLEVEISKIVEKKLRKCCYAL